LAPSSQLPLPAYVSIRQHTSTSVGIRQHSSAYVSILQHTLHLLQGLAAAYLHTSAYVSIRQHTSAYVSIRCTCCKALNPLNPF
jgi:hypothetical protein